ncbi:DUF1697 domain-containing protein [Phreatobacter sp. AB_2022a]|uniref:DUF1697 domain-containing protein n=1 Tax=Phreatobacter sp. AB_2022a TaxID=3003134 RepID=UPI002286F233|nr:DUF1697 domain-containing protein [Phreatobacter sp. AB_2022a]MCZ0738228.1 DUF1697 domain-containing protein [Phreatobacter sp. AB_2022a]
MTVHVALIRAIGPATHARMSMKDLSEGCRAAGLAKVSTYIQTGNVIVDTRFGAPRIGATVSGVLRRFGLGNDVVVRRADALAALAAADPYPDAAAARPDALVVMFLAEPPEAERLATLLRHGGPERISVIGPDLCIDYAGGITGSKLLPGTIERRLGIVGTARNWNTVRRLAALSAAF